MITSEGGCFTAGLLRAWLSGKVTAGTRRQLAGKQNGFGSYPVFLEAAPGIEIPVVPNEDCLRFEPGSATQVKPQPVAWVTVSNLTCWISPGNNPAASRVETGAGLIPPGHELRGRFVLACLSRRANATAEFTFPLCVVLHLNQPGKSAGKGPLSGWLEFRGNSWSGPERQTLRSKTDPVQREKQRFR